MGKKLSTAIGRREREISHFGMLFGYCLSWFTVYNKLVYGVEM